MEDKKFGCVYFFRHVGLTPVKIGFTDNESPIHRFDQFKTYAPYGSEILGFIQTDEANNIERMLHKKYSYKRLQGEWFEITEEEVKKEIDSFTNLETIKERNNFQIAYAKHLANKKLTLKEISGEVPIMNKQDFFTKVYGGRKINKKKVSLEIGVSRQTIFRWEKELNKKLKR